MNAAYAGCVFDERGVADDHTLYRWPMQRAGGENRTTAGKIVVAMSM